MAAVKQARADYPDARHHCWAYLLGSPCDARSAGMSDDGEPAGTAGKPILNVLQHGLIGDVLVIVVRYFGGIKLGAGGLVRAYGTATAQALERVPSQEKIEMQGYQLAGDFSREQLLRHWLGTVGGTMQSVEYGESLSFYLNLPMDMEEALAAFCAANQLDIEQP